MAKCGKGCMPECQYFTTGGCVSPFNCLYKVEETYSNSATSNTACYAGTSYTEAQPDESEAGIRKWYREQVGHEPANYDAAALKAYIAHLEVQNAELQEKDIKCADSVDEMIAMCDKCGLHECCGCEHSYSAVQGVKELKTERKAYEVASNQYRIWFEEQKDRAEVAEKALDLCETAYILSLNHRATEGISGQAIASDLGVHKFFIKQAEKELAEEEKE